MLVKVLLRSLNIYFFRTGIWINCVISNCKKKATKYQTYPKSGKIDGFGREIWFCHKPNYDFT